MNLPPKDYTKQENIIAECLDKAGLRYAPQYEIFPYTVDFYIPEIKMIIEADGKMGHLKKRDAKRDSYLRKQFDVDDVVHIKDITKEKIEEKLWQELSKLNKTV